MKVIFIYVTRSSGLINWCLSGGETYISYLYGRKQWCGLRQDGKLGPYPLSGAGSKKRGISLNTALSFLRTQFWWCKSYISRGRGSIYNFKFSKVTILRAGTGAYVADIRFYLVQKIYIWLKQINPEAMNLLKQAFLRRVI